MRWLAGVLVSVGCYSPSYKDCEISCASGAGCPSGLHCDEFAFCRTASGSGNCPRQAFDAAADSSFPCWLGEKPPTNFDPCTNFPPIVSFTFVGGDVFDTDAKTYGAAMAPGTMYATPQGQSVWLLHVMSFDIPSPQHFNVHGTVPLVIVAEDMITIGGVINASLATKLSAAECTNTAGGPGNATGGGGGGGGGNGGQAGIGGPGSNNTGAGGNGDIAHYDQTLSPLHPGCPGDKGGDDAFMTSFVGGGSGGQGGGALELVSARAIILSSNAQILAGGGPGSDGLAMAGANIASGGGGGGAGGAILLEAPMITIPTGTSVCAGGAGGGQGGSSVNTPGTAMTGGCVVAGGANGGPGGGQGGDGSIDQSVPGTSGIIGDTGATNGGGGGGGGAGRIRFHGTTMVAGMVAPMATSSP